MQDFYWLLTGEINYARFPDYVHFDFPGIFKVVFNPKSNLSGKISCFKVADFIRCYENADFSSGLNGI